jgi:Ca-activated chloride channel family protein
VGVGADYGDAFMETLADKGDGFVVYVSTTAEARRVFVQQLPANLTLQALDAKAQVAFNPKVVSSYRLLGYDDRTIDPSAFRDDRTDGGEVGPGHTVTALYLVRLNGEADGKVADVSVRWTDPAGHIPTELTEPVRLQDLDGSFGSASSRLQVCYAAAYFAEVLHGGSLAGEVRLTDLEAITGRAATATEDHDIDELTQTIKAAERLMD